MPDQNEADPSVERSERKFSLGVVVATLGALAAFEESGEEPAHYLQRHCVVDWGDVDEHDRKENEFSFEHGFRLLSVFTLKSGVRVWCITESDRSISTLLLPEEY